MELQEKLGYVAMLFLSLLARPVMGFTYDTGLALSLKDITPWITVIWLLLLGLAFLLFALDGLVGGLVPDSLAPLVAWIAVLIQSILIILMALLNQLKL